MGKDNKKTMQIPKELLSESKYEGTRLILIEDEKLLEYKGLLKALQEEANPILDVMDEWDKKVEPFRQKVKGLKDDNQKDYEAMRPFKEQYELLARELPEDATDSTPEMKILEEKMNPIIDRIRGREVEISQIREEMKPSKDAWDSEHEKVQAIDRRAAVIKEKMIPFIHAHLDGKLGEFEEAKHLIEKDNKVYAEVFDLIEEFIKTHRTKHA